MRKRWKIKQVDEELKERLSRSLGLHPAVSRVLVARGIRCEDEARRFLEADLSYLHSPSKLKGIDKAVKRIKKALDKREKILIYGDYDVDGITGVSLLYTILNKFTDNLTCYIPNRLEEGYGLNKEACAFAKEKKVSLLITVDCGISGYDEVDYLNSHNIDIIITDHHQPQDRLPKAYSIIDPYQPGCDYPFKDLAGVGVAFKLAQSLLSEFMDDAHIYLMPHLDLVALGTISDVVPILDENRIFVKYGLRQLNQTQKVGLKSLIKISRLHNRTISSSHIGYILGPRINAAGRLGDADAPLRLLLTEDENEAEALAKLLDDGNRHRQKIQEETLKEALGLIEKEINFKDYRVIVLDGDWHPGVMGIVASRIVERFYRPTILISTREDVARGSGRSIDNFHLFEAIKKCSLCLEGFGGHKKACGIRILKDNISRFRDMLNEQAHKTLSTDDLFPTIEIDSELSLGEIGINLLNELDRLLPYGTSNPEPIFSSRNLYLKGEPVFLKKDGIKLLVTDGKITYEAVGFSIRGVDFHSLRGKNISLAYTPTLKNFEGRDYITLEIKDIKIEN